MSFDDRSTLQTSATSNAGFFSNFSSKFSTLVGRKSDDGVYGPSGHDMPSTSSAAASDNAPVNNSKRRQSGHRNSKSQQHRNSATLVQPSTSASSWLWKRRVSSGRTSISSAAYAVAEKLSSSKTNQNSASSSTHGLFSGIFSHSNHAGSNSNNATLNANSTGGEVSKFSTSVQLRERVILPKKVPDFLIPNMTSNDRQKLGGSFMNLKSAASSSVLNASNQPGTSLNRNKSGTNALFLPNDGAVTSSSSFYGALPSSGTSNDIILERDRHATNRSSASGEGRRSSLWRRTSIPYSSLDNLIFGTLQTNELIKRSSTELINDLVQIIAPETTKKSNVMDVSFGAPMLKTVAASLSTVNMAGTNSEHLLRLGEGLSVSGHSNTSMASKVSQWECYQRCIVSVRLQLVEHQRHCLLSVFFRRLHNTASSANFYSSLKSSVMTWKVRLTVATKSCKIHVKRKFTINGPMPLDENELFSNVRIPKLSKLLNHSYSIWLRLQLSHRPVDDYDDEEAEDDTLWQDPRKRRSKSSLPKKATTRTQRFAPFQIFINNLLPVPSAGENHAELECPSVRLARRDKQTSQNPTAGQYPVYVRTFAAFPCCCTAAAAFDKTLLSSSSDKRNMVLGLMSVASYVFASSPLDLNEPLNIVLDVQDIFWKKPGLVMAKFLDFWLFAKIIHGDGKEEKFKTGMKTSRLMARSEISWRVRTVAKRGSVKSVLIRLSGRTINASHVIANVELSEASEDYVAAQLFHSLFRHVYHDDHFNRPAETLSKSLLRIAGDGDESNSGIRRCFTIETALQLIAVA